MKILILILLTISNFSFSQTPSMTEKIPRVIELEEKLIEEGSSYFAHRFREEPFFIKVNVTPLRRSIEAAGAQDSLPYLDQVSEELEDEWDDPITPINFLRNRVKEITVELDVPDNFTELQLIQIKEDLYNQLKLYPIRDKIEVKPILKTISKIESLPTYYYYVGGAIFLSILSLGLVLKFGTKTSQPMVNKESSSAPMMAAAPASSGSSHDSHSDTQKKYSADVRGDVNFHDPVKMKDLVGAKIAQILKSETFPTLFDLMEMENLSRSNNAQLGALIFEFPVALQKTCLEMAYNHDWLQALSEPGNLNNQSLEVLDKMGRNREWASQNRNVETLLIQIWRMDDQAVNFFKKIDQAHAFSLLSLMPKSIALRIARKAYPGSWAKILEDNKDHVLFDVKTLEDYYKLSLTIAPPLKWEMLKEFRNSREIIKYLDLTNVDEEKEIYESLHQDSHILTMRYPFYKVFEQTDDELKKMLGQFPLEKMALVLCQSSRNYIKRVISLLDEKQKIIFTTRLKKFDTEGFKTSEQVEWKKKMSIAAKTTTVTDGGASEKASA
jgi:hypothetical protein